MDSVEFLHSVWQVQGRGYAFLALRTSDNWREFPIEYPGKVLLPNPHLGDVYFCPNLFSGTARRAASVLPSCWLYADLDQVEPIHVEVELSPSVAWESSPNRYQAMWHLDTHLNPLMHSRLNKKLTYALGADRSGWDLTQVLRVPGTINHKYEQKPKVQLLWEDDELHDEVLGGLRHHTDVFLTSDDIAATGEPCSATPDELMYTYRHVLPTWVRIRLRAKRPSGDRSRVLWKLECGLFEAGLSEGEVFVLVKNTVWNKFPGDDAQLWRDVHRAAQVKR